MHSWTRRGWQHLPGPTRCPHPLILAPALAPVNPSLDPPACAFLVARLLIPRVSMMYDGVTHADAGQGGRRGAAYAAPILVWMVGARSLEWFSSGVFRGKRAEKWRVPGARPKRALKFEMVSATLLLAVQGLLLLSLPAPRESPTHWRRAVQALNRTTR